MIRRLRERYNRTLARLGVDHINRRVSANQNAIRVEPDRVNRFVGPHIL